MSSLYTTNNRTWKQLLLGQIWNHCLIPTGIPPIQPYCSPIRIALFRAFKYSVFGSVGRKLLLFITPSLSPPAENSSGHFPSDNRCDRFFRLNSLSNTLFTLPTIQIEKRLHGVFQQNKQCFQSSTLTHLSGVHSFIGLLTLSLPITPAIFFHLKPIPHKNSNRKHNHAHHQRSHRQTHNHCRGIQ